MEYCRTGTTIRRHSSFSQSQQNVRYEWLRRGRRVVVAWFAGFGVSDVIMSRGSPKLN